MFYFPSHSKCGNSLAWQEMMEVVVRCQRIVVLAIKSILILAKR